GRPVTGHPFRNVEVARILFAGVIERAENSGTDALDVPEMEELMSDHEYEMAITGRQHRAISGQRYIGRVQVFDPARAGPCGGAKKEDVLFERRAAHHVHKITDHGFYIAGHLFPVKVAVADEDQRIRNSLVFEPVDLEVRAGDYRSVNESVIIRRLKGQRIAAVVHPGFNAPSCRQSFQFD